ncbi:MAG: hypothetical protein PF482_20720 [Desulfobacteraceae bacterium]|jgi:small-conductance mechanosensitive channel|nr:hypothetical protein [Desulfobacteraceae bacterium]
MSLIQLVITLVVIGAILWAIDRYIPMNAAIKKLVNIVVVVVAVLFVLQYFGIIGSGHGIMVIG